MNKTDLREVSYMILGNFCETLNMMVRFIFLFQDINYVSNESHTSE